MTKNETEIHADNDDLAQQSDGDDEPSEKAESVIITTNIENKEVEEVEEVENENQDTNTGQQEQQEQEQEQEQEASEQSDSEVELSHEESLNEKDASKVKLYISKGAEWVDKGTGYLQVRESSDDLVSFAIVEDNTDEFSDDVLLKKTVTSTINENYRIEEQSMIIWNTEQYSTNFAISFLRSSSCLDLWDKISKVRRVQPCLPTLSLETLDIIEAKLIDISDDIILREKASDEIIKSDFIPELIKQSEIFVNEKNFVGLNQLYRVVKLLLLLAHIELTKTLLSDEFAESVFLILNYGPQVCENLKDAQTTSSKLEQIGKDFSFPLPDTAKSSLVFLHRIQYLRQVFGGLEECFFVFDEIEKRIKNDIGMILSENVEWMKSFIASLSRTATGSPSRENHFDLLHQIVNLATTFATTLITNLGAESPEIDSANSYPSFALPQTVFNVLYKTNAISVIVLALDDPNEVIRRYATETVYAIAINSPETFRAIILTQKPHFAIMKTLLKKSLIEPKESIREALFETIKELISIPTNSKSPLRCNPFLQFFYRHCEPVFAWPFFTKQIEDEIDSPYISFQTNNHEKHKEENESQNEKSDSTTSPKAPLFFRDFRPSHSTLFSLISLFSHCVNIHRKKACEALLASYSPNKTSFQEKKEEKSNNELSEPINSHSTERNKQTMNPIKVGNDESKKTLSSESKAIESDSTKQSNGSLVQTSHESHSDSVSPNKTDENPRVSIRSIQAIHRNTFPEAFIENHDELIARIANIATHRAKFVGLAAIQFLSTILQMRIHTYELYIVKNKLHFLLLYVLSINSKRQNTLYCSCLAALEFIFSTNIEVLIDDFVHSGPRLNKEDPLKYPLMSSLLPELWERYVKRCQENEVKTFSSTHVKSNSDTDEAEFSHSLYNGATNEVLEKVFVSSDDTDSVSDTEDLGKRRRTGNDENEDENDQPKKWRSET